MGDFNNTISQLKEGLKGFITNESTKETIDTIAGLDKLVDDAVADYEKVTQDYSGLKDDYLYVVKNTGFKSKVNPIEEDITGKKEMSFEDCLAEALENNK